MKNANVLVLCIAAAVILLIAAAGLLLGQQSSVSLPADSPAASADPAAVQILPAPPQADSATQAYVRIQVGGEIWPDIPLTDGGEYIITQPVSGAVNVLHTTSTGVVMHSSTCDNQNCVQQGEVTLENQSTRVLGSLIVCLPNQVVVELISADAR